MNSVNDFFYFNEQAYQRLVSQTNQNQAADQAWSQTSRGGENSSANQQENTSPPTSPVRADYENNSAAAGFGRNRHSGRSMAKKLRGLFGLKSKNRGKDASTSRQSSSAEVDHSSYSRTTAREPSPSRSPSPSVAGADSPERFTGGAGEYSGSAYWTAPQLPSPYDDANSYHTSSHQPYGFPTPYYAAPPEPYSLPAPYYATPEPYGLPAPYYVTPEPYGSFSLGRKYGYDGTLNTSEIRIVRGDYGDTRGCGITCIAMIAQVSYPVAREATIKITRVNPNSEGLDVHQMRTILKHFGIESSVRQAVSWSDISDLALVPVIHHPSGRPHGVVFVRSNGQESVYDTLNYGPVPCDVYLRDPTGTYLKIE